jgi:hypothetical protein
MNAFRGTVSEQGIMHLWKKIFVDYENRHENQVIDAGCGSVECSCKERSPYQTINKVQFVGMGSASLRNRFENQKSEAANVRDASR